MKSLHSFCIFAFISIFLFSGFNSTYGQSKATNGGELEFTVRTVTAGGNYAPKHVLAIWVEHQSSFVKTRKAMAAARKQYLYTWKAASNYNVVDAITGPTLSSHQTHTVNWDCTDLNGDIVPDGDYVVWVEFTEKHAQGPLYSITFTKGPDPQFISPPDEVYFKDISLTFTPVICDFVASDTTVCVGDTVIFTDASVNATNWEWNFGVDAVPVSANTQGPHEVVYHSYGSKVVNLTINNSVTEWKANYVNVGETPFADYHYSVVDMTVYLSNNSISADDYIWDLGDGNTSTDVDVIHSYANPGTYDVQLLAINNDCSDDTVQQITVPAVGILENITRNDVSIFPNPTTGIVHLKFDKQELIKEFRIINNTGQRVKSILPSDPQSKLHDLNLNDLDKGVYFIEIQLEKESILERIIIL